MSNGKKRGKLRSLMRGCEMLEEGEEVVVAYVFA
jgi:hypothetical protein